MMSKQDQKLSIWKGTPWDEQQILRPNGKRWTIPESILTDDCGLKMQFKVVKGEYGREFHLIVYIDGVRNKYFVFTHKGELAEDGEQVKGPLPELTWDECR